MQHHTQKNRWTRIAGIGGTILVALCWATVRCSLAQEDEVIARGKKEYQQACAVCHGTNGRGNGVMAELLRVSRPADLTQLRKKEVGQFPFWRVYRVIDGREEVSGHGLRDMPIWGAQFKIEHGGNEDTVSGRIWQLIYYLQSIQEE